MSKLRFTILGGAAVLALSLTVALPAQAETRNFAGVSREGNGYTTTKTRAFWDQSLIGKYPTGSPSDSRTFGPNHTGAIEVHNNYTTYKRTTNAIVNTPVALEYYLSAAHKCDN